MHRHLRDEPPTVGGRSISRKSTFGDVQLVQRAVAATVQSLSLEPAFKAAFGGQNHSAEQLRLAAHGEVFALPFGEDARTAFFEKLNDEVLTAFGLRNTYLDPPLMVVFKGINQKVRSA